MEGVNSPHRGWFKLSFGGDIRPYYQIVLSNWYIPHSKQLTAFWSKLAILLIVS